MSSIAEQVRSLGRYIHDNLPFTRSQPRRVNAIEPPIIVIEAEDNSRRGRRKALRALHQQPVGVLHKTIIDLDNQLRRSKSKVDKTLGLNRVWVEIIYQEEPVLLGYLSVRQRLAETMDYLQTANLKIPLASPVYLKRLERENLFAHQVGGVSLLEIEDMPMRPQLSLEDISRIDRITMDGKKFNVSNEDNYIRAVLLYLATINFAQPGSKINIPENLRDLQRRAVNYFDYYTDLMTQFNLPPQIDARLLWDFLGGRTFFPHALAAYIPARRGITPSSAVKLFETKFSSIEPAMGISSKIWARRLMRAMINTAMLAYPSNSLPEDLEKYQHYDPEADKRASEQVLQHFESYPADSEVYENAASFLKKFQDQYRKNLRREIAGSRVGRVKIETGQAGIAGSLSVARHFQDTLMFVLHFDQQTHLTVEFDRQGRIYGIPLDLFRNDPNVSEAIANRLLQPVMKWLDLRYPPPPQTLVRIPTPMPTLVELPVKEDSREVSERLDEKVRVPKRKTLRFLSPSEIMHTTPKTDVASDVERRRCVVIHSRKMVQRLLPRNSPEEVIDRIMSAIKDFEFGRDTSAKTLQQAGGLIQIRTGDFRIEMSRSRGRVYNLVDAGDKKDIRKRIQPKALT